METFADRMKKIRKKYSNADSSAMERGALEDEASVLADEQDAVKLELQRKQAMEDVQNEMQPIMDSMTQSRMDTNQFALGGGTQYPNLWGDVSNYLGKRKKAVSDVKSLPGYAPTPEEERAIEESSYLQSVSNPGRVKLPDGPQGAISAETEAWMKRNKPTQVSQVNTPSGKGKRTPGKLGKAPSEVGKYMKENPEVLMAASAHIPSIIANTRNRRELVVPDRIDPRRIVPSITQTRYSTQGVQNKVNALTQSRAENIMRSDVGFAAKMDALRKINMDGLGVMADSSMQEQQLNSTEQARVDSIVNNAIAMNVDSENSADIDQQVRLDNYRRSKAQSNVAIADSYGGLFSEISNAMMAEKVGEWMKKQGILNVDTTPV